MLWLTIAVPAAAAWMFGRREHPALFWLSVITAVAAFWSYGIMHNFAYQSAAERRARLIDNMQAEGRPAADIAHARSLPVRMTGADARLAPNWATTVNMGAALAGVILLVLAFFIA